MVKRFPGTAIRKNSKCGRTPIAFVDKAGREREHFSPGPVQLKVIRIESLVNRGRIELSTSEEIPE